MSITDVLGELERAGSARQRKALEKAGVRGPMFGVTGAQQRTIARRIKRDQGMAEALWSTGNHDARMLATLIADASAMPGKLFAEWIAAVDCALLAEAVATVAATHPGARAMSAGWRASADPWPCAVGWTTLAKLTAALADAELPPILAEIERRAPTSTPCVQLAMAAVLVAIGARGDRPRTIAIETARRAVRAGAAALAGAETTMVDAVTTPAVKARAPTPARPRRLEARPTTAAAKARRPRS